MKTYEDLGISKSCFETCPVVYEERGCINTALNGKSMLHDQAEMMMDEDLQPQIRNAMEGLVDLIGGHNDLSDEERVEFATQLDQMNREGLGKLLDAIDDHIETHEEAIAELARFCPGPLTMRATRDNVQHTVTICTSLREQTVGTPNISAARVSTEFIEAP